MFIKFAIVKVNIYTFLYLKNTIYSTKILKLDKIC